MQKITPNLWFDKQADEAANFYVSAFGNGEIDSIVRYPDAGKEIHGQEAGSVMTVEFEIDGLKIIALNGGPMFKFTPAISLMVSCPTEADVDALHAKLSEGGSDLMPLGEYPFSKRYAWTADKYGLSWQLIHVPDTGRRTVFPSLLFVGDVYGKAEEAMNFYVSLFENSSVGDIARYGAGQEFDKEGAVMYADFTLAGQRFAAMDSGYDHKYSFNEAFSLLVNCADQAEVDKLWDAMSADPKAEQCGWLKDNYGVSWQISPEGIEAMLGDSDKEKHNRVMEAMLKMKKLDLVELIRAFEGK